MGKLEEFLDKNENKLWQTAFPNCWMLGQQEGVYEAPDLRELLSALQNGMTLTGEENRALIRLDLAIACLWQHVHEEFPINLFPHRLAAATDLLRAVNFGEGQSEEITKIAAELMQALDQLEQVLAPMFAEKAELPAAAEGEDK